MIINITRKAITLIVVFSLFATIFSLISLVNHYQFRTYALDLGMFNHAIYSIANFKQAYFTLGIDGKEMPFFATHFSLLTIIYAPLYYLFGSYTLLIIQIFAILSGGIAVYKYAKNQFEDNSNIPLIIVIHFFSIWGIYSALSFDFHNNIIGAMLVVWFVYYLEKRKLIYSFIFLLLILFAKETMSFWMFFIILGLMIKNRKKYSNKYLKFEIPATIFCLLYGIIVINFIMPLLQDAESNLQLGRYSHLGGSLRDIALTIIKNPQYLFSLLFENTLEYPVYNGIKLESHFMILVSGGIVLFFRPAYFIMLIPIYAQKFLSNDYGLWGINSQYSIEFVPILSLAVIDFIQHIKKHKVEIAVIIALLTLIFNVNSIDHRVSKWYNAKNTQFYNKKHYNPELNISEINKTLKLISNDSKISVISCLAPHLAFREKIYHFPIVKDADYIVLITNNRGTYPLSAEDFMIKLKEYKNSGNFNIVYEANDLLIMKKKN